MIPARGPQTSDISYIRNRCCKHNSVPESWLQSWGIGSWARYLRVNLRNLAVFIRKKCTKKLHGCCEEAARKQKVQVDALASASTSKI